MSETENQKTNQTKPVAVLISDVHYSLNTLELADNAFRQAIDKARKLQVPLIDCGDLTNDKAILRGEVVNKILATMEYAAVQGVQVYALVGNHSLINEKGKEHVLNFLTPYAQVVQSNYYDRQLGLHMIPYCNDPELLKETLSLTPEGSTIIMHQGVQTAKMGHYIIDKTSLPKEAFANFRVISGHYHARQDIKTGRPRKGAVGLFSYIGNPYTLSWGEANDPEKGFQVLYSDGSLEFVPTNLRKHVIKEIQIGDMVRSLYEVKRQDLLWIKIHGKRSELQQVKKKDMAINLGRDDFKLDLIPTDSENAIKNNKNLKDTEILDQLIDSLSDTDEHKSKLKALWREVL
jgi:hypothetical protein